MSSTSQLTTFSDIKMCSRCGAAKPSTSFSRHAWCKECCSAYNKNYTRHTPPATKAQNRARALKTRFGMTVEQYEVALAQQGGVCAICSVASNIEGKNFCVDHDHATGKVRGLLCHKCNAALGHFKDSTALLMKAADYLEGYK